NVENGMVTPRFAGNATITATPASGSGKSGTCEVEVAEPVNLPAVDTYLPMRGGTIKVGDIWNGEPGDSGDDNKAKYDINVSAFKIGKTEVRYELWYIVREWGEGHGYTFENKGQAGKSGGVGAFPVSPSKDEPVTTINWRDAVVWCNAYSEITGKEAVYRNKDSSVLKDSTKEVENLVIDDKAKIELYNGYRLPTEREWEYTARGGKPSAIEWAYQWAGTNTDLGNFAWYYIDSTSTTHPVGQKTANSAGLYDMSGNVWEWCFNTYSVGSMGRAVRGGSWRHNEGGCSVAFRSGTNNPDNVINYLGFRVVCSR
ncbi:MAG: formylglycine-generating enzyme family protein, partial [Spirochaetaceae bacterium]|nr:formylglycine-generating enzyme family protein [Spirochaetaceae bacterium]